MEVKNFEKLNLKELIAEKVRLQNHSYRFREMIFSEIDTFKTFSNYVICTNMITEISEIIKCRMCEK